MGISRAKLMKRKTCSILKYNTKNTDSEIAKLDYCIKSANDELNQMYKTMSCSQNDLIAGIIKKYIDILNSRKLSDEIENMINERKVSAEYAISTILDNSKKQLEKLDDEYLNGKSGDIEEIKHRLLSKLKKTDDEYDDSINGECIIVAEDLTAGEVLNMDPSIVKGIVTIYGGPTSSCSVIARRKKIPAVNGVGMEGYSIKDGDLLVVDGDNGRVFINPDENVIRCYLKRIGV